MERDTENERNRRRNMRMHILLAVDAALLAAILLVSGLLLYRSYNRETEQHLSQIQAPDWYTQDFLTVNPYSRPGTKREHVRDIVIHYVANPGTSAKQNRNYFEGLKDQSGSKTVSASSHYIIGSDGTILQCIPLDEVAYGNYPRNDDTAKDLAPSAFFGHVNRVLSPGFGRTLYGCYDQITDQADRVALQGTLFK